MRTARGRFGPGGRVRTGTGRTGTGRTGTGQAQIGGGPTSGGTDVGGEPGPGGTDVDVVDLPGAPGLGGLYAAGVLGSARAAAGGLVASVGASGRATLTVGPDDLPRTVLRLDGIRPDAEHLTDYQHLLGEPASDVLPAGFLHVTAFPVAMALMVRRDFPLPLLGMVHVANRVEQRRAVRLGEPLDVRVAARDLRAHRSGVTVDVVAEIAVADVVVWQGVSTYLAKGVRLASGRGGGEGTAGPGDQPVHTDESVDQPGRPDQPDQADQRVFEPPAPTGQWRLSADVGRRYAAVSGDRNPIHLSSVAAKAFGFPRTIAHGMYTASRALADVGAARGESFVWEVEFAKPVLLPSTVTVRVAADTDRTPGAFRFVGWDSRKGRRHFTGTVTPLA